MKKHLCIVSRFYPPLNHVATGRIEAMVKYLDKEAFDISIVTLANSQRHKKDSNVIEVKQSGLLNKKDFYNSSSRINHMFKAGFNKVFLHFLVDEYHSWTKGLNKALEELHRKQPIDALLCSFAPVSPLLAGLKFKTSNPESKLILDMRDEFSESPFISKKRKKRLKALEKKLLSNSDLLISVSSPIVNSFRELSNNQVKCVEVRNGYDFEFDFNQQPNSKFCITYTGTFYGNRKPNTFFEAISSLIAEKKIKPEHLDIKFISPVNSYTVPKELNKYVRQLEKIDKNDALKEMKNSALLLLIHPNNGVKGIFTGKIFEYLASLRPILALVDKTDVAAELIRSANAGYVAEFSDIDEIKSKLIECYSDWELKTPYKPDLDIIKNNHRKNQIEILNQELIKLFSNE